MYTITIHSKNYPQKTNQNLHLFWCSFCSVSVRTPPFHSHSPPPIHSKSMASSSSLADNYNPLSPQQQELVKMLLNNGQEHLFRDWPPPGVDDDQKQAFFDQVPAGETMIYGDENFINYEETGVREARKAAFVLVAGGLGERLGYSGIKVALPAETTTGTCFLQHYIESILALQEASSQDLGESQTQIPFVIMTSDDTHGRTLELLESNSYFGMQPTQVTLLKQEKVACLEDNDARLALEPQNKYKIQLILELGAYIEELSKTEGAIQEFVNPKYKDATKTSFKSSTRLECMMQDYPKTLPPSARVGFTVMETWLAYAPVKNNPEEASKVQQVPKGNPYHSATSGEMAIYRANSLILKKAGVQVADPVLQVINGQEVEVWPRVTWKPKWGLTFSLVKSKVGGNCSISQRSTLAIKGQNIFIEDLSLDGALIIDAVHDAEVNVRGAVQNEGWILETVDYEDTSLPEEAVSSGRSTLLSVRSRMQMAAELFKKFDMNSDGKISASELMSISGSLGYAQSE
ncbi:hypothetical protein Fmac_007668 [Flemingia macrophylla]|uniref:UTP-monosaccharide-1-phosphate uridylyltransferase n=1 Tax=Flemingia macrophylla TaxID=520843 RepID=A0ABD1MV86_9FABA